MPTAEHDRRGPAGRSRSARPAHRHGGERRSTSAVERKRARPTRSRPRPPRASAGSRSRSRSPRAARGRRRRRRAAAPSWCSSDASTTPTSAQRDARELRRPTGGRRSRSRTTTGTIAETPAIGATTLIAPIAHARGSTRRARACPTSAAGIANSTAQPCGRLAAHGDGDRDRDDAADLRPEEHAQRARASGRRAAPTKSRDAPREARAEREQRTARQLGRRGGSRRPRRAGSRGRARPPRRCGRRARRGARRRSAGAPRAARRVERPRARSSIRRRPRWTWPSSRPSSVGAKAGPRAELERAADVVHERRREQQVAAQPRMQLGGLAAERRDADRVLEQAAGVGVVAVGRGRERGEVAVGEHRAARSRDSPGCDDLARRGTRGSRRARPRRGASSASATPGSTSVASSERTSSCSRSRNRSTRPSTRTASPSAKRPSSSSTSFQTRASIRPLGSTSSSARYGAPPFVRSFRFALTA